MKTEPDSEGRKGSTFSIALSCVLCALAIFSFLMLRESAYRSESALLKSVSEKVAGQISAKIQTILEIGEQFRQLLLTDSGKTYASLKLLADESLAKLQYIDSITVAPGAIVRYCFPEEKASGAIGRDLLDGPDRMQALVRAVSRKKAVLQGPTLSADGRNLAFLRVPVFNGADLWGFVSVGFDTDRMIEYLELGAAFPGMLIAVASSEPEESGNSVFWGDQSAVQGYPARVKAGVENVSWTVYVASNYPARQAIWWGVALVALSILSLGLFVSRIFTGRRLPERTMGVNIKAELALKEASFAVAPFVPQEKVEKVVWPGASEAECDELPRQAALAEDEADARIPGAAPSSEQPGPPPGSPISMSGAPVSPAQPGTNETIRLAPERPVSVLVVDDSEVNREILLRMLALKGYEAEAVDSGAAALSTLKKRTFDVVLIDCIMPDMDGFALAREIRKSEASTGDKKKPVALIAMSPRHDLEEAERSSQAGFDSLLVKPFTMTALDQKIGERVL